MSSMIVANGVSYELTTGRTLLKNLTFSLDSKLTALVGPNGVGKTSLAKLITGEIEPTAGVVRRDGSVKRLAQREDPPSITVAEYLADQYEWSLIGETFLRPIDVETLCTSLSGGQWMRVRLARALSEDFLILDEPTNDLDREGREVVAQFLRSRRGGALLISHDRECLQACGEILELSNLGLAKFVGSWSEYLENKEQERQRLSAALDQAKRKRESAREEQVERQQRQDKRNRRGAQAALRGGIPRILIGSRKRQAQVTTGKVHVASVERANEAVRAAHDALAAMKVDPVMYADLVGGQIPAQKLVVEASGFNIRFQDWIYREDLDFAWRGNVRVVLQGANGSGKSSLLKVLAGADFETRGVLRRGDLINLYLDQRCSSLDETKSVFDNVRMVTSASDSEVRNGLARFLFTGDAVFDKVSTLSGGERLRAALARGFLSTQRPKLLMLDEPTNNLGLANVEFLESIVSEFRGALLVVSHDEQFLANCGITHEFAVQTK